MINKVHRLAGTNSTSYTDAEMVADFNDSLAELEMEAGFSDSDGEWDDPRFDNTNGGRPIGEVDLTLDETVYSFYKDASDNRILSIYKVNYVDPQGGKTALIRGRDYDAHGDSIELTFKPSATRVGSEEANYLEVYFTREGLRFATDSLSDESPFPADFDKFLIYRNVESFCTAEAEDPSMRAKADRYERKAEQIKPRFKKWLQRYFGRGKTVLKGRRYNFK